MEIVNSLDEVKISQSVAGKNFPNFEMPDVKIASSLNKIIKKSHFQGEGQSRGAESPKGGSVPKRKTDRFHDLRLIFE